MRLRGLDLVAGYYLATPLFAVADFALGVPVRVAGLPGGGARLAYYAVAFALGLLCRTRPEATPFVGMLESTVNLTLLLMAILVPIWSLPDAVLQGASPEVGLSGAALANALLGGTALIVSFHRNRKAAGRALGSGPGPRR